MDKMTDSRAADVLAAHNEWRRYDGFSGETGAPAAQHPTEIGLAIDYAIARLREPAEAQAQGGGDAELRHMVAKLAAHVRPTCGDLWAEAERLLNRTAPPSAPVGVDAIKSAIAELDALRNAMFKTYAAAANGADQAALTRLIEAERDAYESHYSLPKLRDALAQQPAADEEAAEQFRKGWQAGYAAAQQPAAVDGAMVRRVAQLREAIESEPEDCFGVSMKSGRAYSVRDNLLCIVGLIEQALAALPPSAPVGVPYKQATYYADGLYGPDDLAAIWNACVNAHKALAQQPAAVDGAKPLDDWHEDDGPVVWWKHPVDEPAWIGTPLDSDWPGYHTHWTPHPAVPTLAAQPGGSDND